MFEIPFLIYIFVKFYILIKHIVMPLVLLTTFTNSFEANVVKGMLADNGIPSVLDGEMMLSVLPMPQSIGPIRMMVRDEDSEKALVLLKSHHNI